MTTIDAARLLEELARERSRAVGVSTTSLNIVAFVENDDGLLGLLRERIEVLGAKHASRCLMLAASPAASEHAVRGELIELPVIGLPAMQLCGYAHDLLVPSVRSVLLWAGEHLSDERFSALADLCDRVVLLSSARGAGVEPLRELLALQATAAAPKIRDLSYLRLLAWQELIAHFFDDPDLAAELPSITRLDVTAGSEPEGYYFVGWLASRLAWQPCGPAEFCNPQGGHILIGFRREGAPRRVRAVSLHSAHSIFGASLDEKADDLVCLTVSGEKERPTRCLPLHDLDMISLVERAIFTPADDGVYGETLRMLGMLLEYR